MTVKQEHEDGGDDEANPKQSGESEVGLHGTHVAHGLDQYAALGLCGRRCRGGALPRVAWGYAWMTYYTAYSATYGDGDVIFFFLQRSWVSFIWCWAPM